MNKQKSLGQIAYEAGRDYALQRYYSSWPAWETRDRGAQDHHEYIAQAVAREVKRRMRAKHGVTP